MHSCNPVFSCREMIIKPDNCHENTNNVINFLFSRHESLKSGIHTRFGDVVPAAPLSPLSCRLLKEFSRRYGVGVLYCRIVYLYYFAE